MSWMTRKKRYQYDLHGFEQSRHFRGLKVWMSFKRYGARQIGKSRCAPGRDRKSANLLPCRRKNDLACSHRRTVFYRLISRDSPKNHLRRSIQAKLPLLSKTLSLQCESRGRDCVKASPD